MTPLDGPRQAPQSGTPATSLVIFLHGFGADGNDLIGIADRWASALPDTEFVSPHAPEPCAGAPMGRQWFNLTMRDPKEFTDGVTAARPALEAFIRSEAARLGIGLDRVALAGFSQGTMMALHTGLRLGSPLAGIVGYSGLLAGAEALKPADISPCPVALVHGRLDEVIPVQALYQAANALGSAEVPVEWHVAQRIGHGIDEDGIQIGLSHLRRVLA